MFCVLLFFVIFGFLGSNFCFRLESLYTHTRVMGRYKVSFVFFLCMFGCFDCIYDRYTYDIALNRWIYFTFDYLATLPLIIHVFEFYTKIW
ncbi:hypothetical protein F5884DRAFT_446961 [Xylogone sp. PMI_703]|nr:hypothetical protein F5884DRAFT_446961 [Xylogone sp. PMI_703]